MKKLETVTISGQEKLNLFINLGTMLRAGIPLLETVDSLLEDTKGKLKIILLTLREDVSAGKTISSSFARFPRAFDAVTVSVLRAAEESGTLDTSLKDIQTNIKKEIEFNDKVQSALLYPAAIVAVFLVVIMVILIFVIPKIAVVFTGLKVVIPLPTKILIFVSNLLTGQWYFVLIALIIFSIGIIILYHKKKRWLVDRVLSLPGISKMARDIDLARFSRSLALLLNVGIPITTALSLASDTVMKRDVALAITKCKDMVTAGKRLSEGFKNAKKIFPKIMIKITEAGEQSGTLGEQLQYISEHLDYQVTNNLRTFTTLLEPIMLVIIGIVIGGIMLSIIGPIYSLISQISPK